MPFLSAVPDLISQASGNLANIGSTLRGTVAAAMSQTTAIAAPAADEVSAAITALFASHARDFQASSAQATSFHDEFVKLLGGGAAQYLNTEVANAEQTAINAVNTPTQALLGHPLIAAGAGQGPAGGVNALAAAATGTLDSTTSTVTRYGPVIVSATSSPNSATFDAYIPTPFGSLSLVSAHSFYAPDPIGPPDMPFTPYDLHLGFLNDGFGWTLSALPVGSNSVQGSFYATNFWATTQGFYTTGPLSGTGTATVSILESFGPLGPTGVSFISQSGSPYVPWIVFDGSPVFAL